MCDRARRLAEVHRLSVVSRITGIPQPTLWFMRKRGWIASGTTRPFRRMPTDYAIQSAHMGFTELRSYYKTGSCCIRRWDRELQG
jgi:hypothetical protein